MWNPIEVYQGQPATGETTMYTVPAGRQAVIKEFIFCNTDTVDRTITINARRGGVAAGVTTRITHTLIVPPGAPIYFPCSLVLNANGILSGLSSVAVITVTVSGEERVL